MAGCSNCDSSFCSCLVTDGAGDGTVNVSVTGSGDTGDPYVVSATVNLCEAAGNLDDGGVAVAGTDRVMVVDGSTCTLKTIPVGGGGGGAFGVVGDVGASALLSGNNLNVLGVGHVNTSVTTGPPGNVNVNISFDEHYTVVGSSSNYSGASPILGVGGLYVVQAIVPAFVINNPSAVRTMDLLFTHDVQGNVTVGGSGQQTADVWGYFSLNGAPPSTVIHGFAGVNENTGGVPIGNSYFGSYNQAATIPAGGSVLVGDMVGETQSFIQAGSGQIDAFCAISWTGGTNQ